MATEIDVKKLAKVVEGLSKDVKALTEQVNDVEGALKGHLIDAAEGPALDGGELKRVAELIDRVVAIIRSPTARITDRNVI